MSFKIYSIASHIPFVNSVDPDQHAYPRSLIWILLFVFQFISHYTATPLYGDPLYMWIKALFHVVKGEICMWWCNVGVYDHLFLLE
jgi:hypothetical protein